ncbi:MAG: AmpG family muropeptide MFS transporter [Salinivirgaceae bacterium]|jgi:PAT family beta-lactamase induction signal transducer AmpG|nr:AmpG family muropeptide MFS transporter [Salinivirgaceae bacterium]
MQKNNNEKPWQWIPSLYFAEGLPYVIVMTLSVIFYKRMGISNTDIALYTSWLYLPWVLKPLWSPFVDIIKTKRWWIVIMQLFIGVGLAGVAFTIPLPHYFQFTLAFFWLLAFSSATHDIAADGFYMLALSEQNQSYFVGIRSTFYRIAMLTGQGLLVIVAGYFEVSTGDISLAWSIVFGIIAVLFVLFFIYHRFMLPRPTSDKINAKAQENIFKEFLATFIEFFKKKEIGVAIIFLMVYRLGESQLVKLASPFMLDTRELNGLGLTTTEIGVIYGTVGIIALSLGGIIGGIAASKKGLKYWLWWMVIAMNLPNLVYVYLSYAMPTSVWLIGTSVAVEQFGYGFGFTAYMLYMIYISDGKHKTAHFALTTGFMALGMMIPGMISGWLQELIGYQHFFIWVMVCTIPGFAVIPFLNIDKEFGRKN